MPEYTKDFEAVVCDRWVQYNSDLLHHLYDKSKLVLSFENFVEFIIYTTSYMRLQKKVIEIERELFPEYFC